MVATTTDAPADLAGRLRHYREQAGLSREEVAVDSRLGFGFRTVAVWETGGRTPGLRHLRELARLYGVAVVDLLGEDDHAPASAA